MSSHSKKRRLSEIGGDDNDSTSPVKKRKLVVDDDKKEIVGLDEEEEDEVVDTTNTTIKNELMHSSEPITLDVGGMKYRTSLHTLTKYRNTVLSKMFEGKFALRSSKDGSYFIDRDGTYFGMILNYLRSGQIIIPQNDWQYIITHLLVESQYYQIASLHRKLRFMSVGSDMLSPQQIADIQTMICREYHKEKHSINWQLLCKYNIVDNTCQHYAKPCNSRSDTCMSIFDDVESVIEQRKSVLIVMMIPSGIWGIFVENRIEDRGLDHSISEGFAFRLSSINEKIEIDKLSVNPKNTDWGTCGIKLSVKTDSHKELEKFTVPTALEVFQL
eukprot:243992_1